MARTNDYNFSKLDNLSTEDDQSIKTKQTKEKKRTYNSQLTAEQLAALQKYFQTERKPGHTEKKRLSEKHGIDPFLLTKWFNAERGRYTRQLKASGGVTKPTKNRKIVKL